MTRKYHPTGARQRKERVVCKVCKNNVYSTLPKKAEVEDTEIIPCPVCQTPYEFSTHRLPRKIGYPVSRRQWGVPTTGVWRENRYGDDELQYAVKLA